MKYIFTIILLTIVTNYCIAQNNETYFENIKGYSDLIIFLSKNKKVEGGAITISSIKDTLDFQTKLYKLDSGNLFTVNDTTYKIISNKDVVFNNFSYIFLDGKSFNKQQADSARNDILALYNLGYSFKKLASMFNMDGNKTGELGWIEKGIMVNTIETALETHKANEIFFVDTPDMNWYHVIKKNSDSKIGKEVKVLWLKTNK